MFKRIYFKPKKINHLFKILYRTFCNNIHPKEILDPTTKKQIMDTTDLNVDNAKTVHELLNIGFTASKSCGDIGKRSEGLRAFITAQYLDVDKEYKEIIKCGYEQLNDIPVAQRCEHIFDDRKYRKPYFYKIFDEIHDNIKKHQEGKIKRFPETVLF